MRVGIYSGSFDPVHNGHLSLALRAIESGLDRVIFAPEASPRGKPDVTPLNHRLRMLELAAAEHSRLFAARLKSQQFTVKETLPEIKALFPDSEIYLIIGSDVVQSLASGWPDLDALRDSVQFIVGLRDGSSAGGIEKLLAGLQLKATCINIGQPYSGISSSKIRHNNLRSGGTTAKIARYITDHKLYNM